MDNTPENIFKNCINSNDNMFKLYQTKNIKKFS